MHQNEVGKNSYFKLFYFAQNQYVTVAGSNIKFSLTLSVCNSSGCSANKAGGAKLVSSLVENDLRV